MEFNSQRAPGIWPLLLVLSGAPFVASLDLFVVNVALGDISGSFPEYLLSQISWVVNGYAVVYAALLVPLGRWADQIGTKQGFVIGLALFTTASAACALAPSLWMLVAFRALQAVGAATMTSASLGLLISTVPAERRSAAIRIWAASGAAAAAFGPVIGGLLVEASWRWIFLINIPVGIAFLAVAVVVVPDQRPVDVGSQLDLLGSALLAVGIGALSLALVQGQDWGWRDGRIVGAFVLTALTLITFWRRNSRHPSPLVEPTLLRVRTFSWSNVTAVLFSAAFAAGLLAAILWLQQVWGYSALKTGLALAPGPVLVPVFAVVGQMFSKRVSPGLIATTGCLLWAVSAVLLLVSVGPDAEYVTEFLPGWLISGAGVGLALPTILSSATTELPPARSATGSAVVNMSRQLGTALGVSLLVAALGTTSGYEATHSAFQFAWSLVAAIAVAAALTSPGMNPRITKTNYSQTISTPERITS